MLLAVFIAYLVIVLGIAVWSLKFSKTKDDYILGGRKLPGSALALSERATGESAWLLLGLTGHGFAEGIASIWVALGCVAGVIFIWLVMSQPLRKASQETGALTVSSLLSRKFPGAEKPIGLVSSLIVIFFFMFYIAAQFSGAGKVVNETFQLDPFWGIVIGSLIVTIYCTFGGFITVVATDAFQAILMIVTLVVLPIIALVVIAQHNVSIAQSLVVASEASGQQLTSLTYGKTGGAAFLFILSGLSWAFGYTGQPQLLTRMMAMRDRKSVRDAKVIAVIWTLLAYGGAVLIGIFGVALAYAGLFDAEGGLAGIEAEHILPVMVLNLMNPLLAGILLSGAISAMMSTASSQLMVSSSSTSEDIYAHMSKRKLSPKAVLNLNKLLTLAVGVIAFILALTVAETVYDMVSYAWSGIGASFGPALLLLLFWKKFSRAGVYASLVTGTSMTIVWKVLFMESTGISERLVAYIASFALAMLFSVLIPEKKERLTS